MTLDPTWRRQWRKSGNTINLYVSSPLCLTLVSCTEWPQYLTTEELNWFRGED
ncbi:hypothetical protein M378DRAFT_168697, partial [Amanita muscaria Koide BX008]